jgi:molybdopterin-binding protein
VNAEVVLELVLEIEVVSVITLASVKSLNLKKGSDAYTVIKASSTIIAVDEG